MVVCVLVANNFAVKGEGEGVLMVGLLSFVDIGRLKENQENIEND